MCVCVAGGGGGVGWAARLSLVVFKLREGAGNGGSHGEQSTGMGTLQKRAACSRTEFWRSAEHSLRPSTVLSSIKCTCRGRATGKVWPSLDSDNARHTLCSC